MSSGLGVSDIAYLWCYPSNNALAMTMAETGHLKVDTRVGDLKTLKP